MAKTFTAELGVEVEVKKQVSRTPREERIIAGFEEIQQFVTKHGRPPQHGEDSDIFERLYAVRLDRIRDQKECRELVAPWTRRDFCRMLPKTRPMILMTLMMTHFWQSWGSRSLHLRSPN